MTDVIPAAAPAAQPMVEETVDPPTIKNAGRVPGYEAGADGLGYALVALVFGLLAVGAMLQALMTNHGLGRRGLALNGLAGFAALAIVYGVTFAAGGVGGPELFGIGLALGVFWLVLALLAFAVGSLVQAPGRVRRRA